jgi:endogenous inhibitor of DNA gyrase (YacG/DUF329 family)
MAQEHCPNLNHSRMNVPLRHCPTCGEIVNRAARGKCDSIRHASILKERHSFCPECGKNLRSK